MIAKLTNDDTIFNKLNSAICSKALSIKPLLYGGSRKYSQIESLSYLELSMHDRRYFYKLQIDHVNLIVLN